MWIFTKCGFFSAVRHNTDKTLIHVRARFKGDLERLVKFAYGHKELKTFLSPTRPRIVASPNADYAFRTDFPADDWGAILAALAVDIDYTNFKNAVHDGTERDSAYMRVWSDMRFAQSRRRSVQTVGGNRQRTFDFRSGRRGSR